MKAFAICFMLVEAINQRKKKLKKYDRISVLMSANILILILMCVFDHINKYISLFYLLVFAQNYINFLGLCYLLRLKHFYYGMQLCYFICFLLSFTAKYGPFCTQQNVYPPVLVFTALLFVTTALLHFYFHFHKYWLADDTKDLISQDQSELFRL